jgi:hypothetical protein
MGQTAPGWIIGVQAHAQGGLAPWPTFGGVVLVERAWRRWALRLSASYMPRSAGTLTEKTPGTAWFSLLSAGIDACPFRWHLTSELELDPCVTLGVGWLEAGGTPSGTSRAEEITGQSPWFETGVLARFSWHTYGPLWVEAQGGLRVLFWPRGYEFVVDDVPKVAYELPPVAIRGGLGLAYHFP